MLRVAGKRIFAGRLGLGLGIGHHASQLPSSSGVGTGAMNAMIMNRMRHLRSVDRHFSSHTKSGSVGFLSSVPSSFRGTFSLCGDSPVVIEGDSPFSFFFFFNDLVLLVWCDVQMRLGLLNRFQHFFEFCGVIQFPSSFEVTSCIGLPTFIQRRSNQFASYK